MPNPQFIHFTLPALKTMAHLLTENRGNRWNFPTVNINHATRFADWQWEALALHSPLVIYWCSDIFHASITICIHYYRSERVDTLSKLIFAIGIFSPGNSVPSVASFSSCFISHLHYLTINYNGKKFNIWDQFIVKLTACRLPCKFKSFYGSVRFIGVWGYIWSSRRTWCVDYKSVS